MKNRLQAKSGLKKHHAKDLVDCCECFGCPVSKK